MTEPLQHAIDQQVEAVQQGNLDAYREIVQQLMPPLKQYVVSRSLPGTDVDDVVQRVFVEAYSNIADYSPGTDFAAWIFTIARYQLMRETTRLRRLADYHRKYVPHALAQAAEQELQLSLPEPDERLPLLQDCLSQLTVASRQLLLQRYSSDLSIGEIAASLNRSAGAVRKQLCLLRKQLHQCIEQRLAEEEHA